MIIRIYALYGRSNIVLGFLMTLWVAQITVTSIGLTTGFRKFFLLYFDTKCLTSSAGVPGNIKQTGTHPNISVSCGLH